MENVIVLTMGGEPGRLIPDCVTNAFLRLNILWDESPEVFDVELRAQYYEVLVLMGVDMPIGLREQVEEEMGG